MKEFKKNIKLLEESFNKGLDVEIEYKGNKRVISSPVCWSSRLEKGDKISAYHISGYSSSNSQYCRSFFIDKIKVIRLIYKHESLNKHIVKLGLVAYKSSIKGVDITVIKDKKGNNKYVLCPADYSGSYALFEWDYFGEYLLEEDGYYIVDYSSIKNPEGDDDYENDGGSSKYRFEDMYDVYLAISLEIAKK